MTEQNDPCVEALLNYSQADEDGVMVVVSRQAIHEAVGLIEALRIALLRERERCAHKADKEKIARNESWSMCAHIIASAIRALPDPAGVDLTEARKVVEDARLYHKLVSLLNSAQCECTPKERMSGHRIGCWKPEQDALIADVIAQKEPDRG